VAAIPQQGRATGIRKNERQLTNFRASGGNDDAIRLTSQRLTLEQAIAYAIGRLNFARHSRETQKQTIFLHASFKS
jgi:hypothetical protein